MAPGLCPTRLALLGTRGLWTPSSEAVRHGSPSTQTAHLTRRKTRGMWAPSSDSPQLTNQQQWRHCDCQSRIILSSLNHFFFFSFSFCFECFCSEGCTGPKSQALYWRVFDSSVRQRLFWSPLAVHILKTQTLVAIYLWRKVPYTGRNGYSVALAAALSSLLVEHKSSEAALSLRRQPGATAARAMRVDFLFCF